VTIMQILTQIRTQGVLQIAKLKKKDFYASITLIKYLNVRLFVVTE